jgi:hypothetical protein
VQGDADHQLVEGGHKERRSGDAERPSGAGRGRGCHLPSRPSVRAHGERGHLALERIATHHERVNRPDLVDEHGLRDRLVEYHPRQPLPMRLGPFARLREAPLVA